MVVRVVVRVVVSVVVSVVSPLGGVRAVSGMVLLPLAVTGQICKMPFTHTAHAPHTSNTTT